MKRFFSTIFVVIFVVSCGADDKPKKDQGSQSPQNPGFNLVQNCDTASGMTVVGNKCVSAKVWIKRGGVVEFGSAETDSRNLVANLQNATFDVNPGYAELRDSGGHIYYGLKGTTEQQHPGATLILEETRGHLDSFMLFNQVNISMRPRIALSLFGIELSRDGQQLEAIERSCRDIAKETSNTVVGTFAKRAQDYAYECRVKEVVSDTGPILYGNVIWACYPRDKTCYFMSASHSLIPPVAI